VTGVPSAAYAQRQNWFAVHVLGPRPDLPRWVCAVVTKPTIPVYGEFGLISSR
jgi:hypothetical protein